jgi:hypothetical protein
MKHRLLKIAKWFAISLVSIFLLITAALYFFKDDICGVVIEEVNKHLKAQVSVSDVDLTFWGSFPNLSVDFNNVFIQDSYAKSTNRDTLLFSERVRLKFNPMDIWNEKYNVKSIEVNPGTIQLKVNSSGEVNYDIMKPSEDSASSPFKFELEKVFLDQVRFSYENEATAQTYRTKVNEMELEGQFSEKQFDIHATSNLKVIKAKSGEVTLLSNRPAALDIQVQVDKEKGTVAFPNALIYISNLPFAVNGIVKPETFSFNVKSKDIQLADLANNLSVQQVDDIKKFEGKGKLNFNLDINGEIKSTEPALIDCEFGIDNGNLTEPAKRINIRDIHLEGKYSNKGGSEKEFLKLANIRFSTVGGPFTGNVLLTKFAAPHFEGNANGNLSLNIVHALFRLPEVENIEGNVKVRTDFDVNMRLVEDVSYYDVNKLEGDVEMSNVLVKIIEDKRVFKNMNGRLYLRNDEAGLEHVTLGIGSSDFSVDGVFKNIIGYLKDGSGLNTNVQLKSNFVDIADLGTTSKEEKISDGRQFVLPNNIDASVFLEVGKLVYEGHTFKRMSGNMVMGNRKIHFPTLTLNNADADLNGNLTIEERSPEIFYLTTNVATNNVNFKSLFREWNNFRQEVIGENNISGQAQAKVYLEAPFDLRSGVISKSIKSEIYIRIQDGHLKNVDAFKSITDNLRTSSSAKLAIGSKNIALLEKKLQDLKFETLENTLIIRNGKMEIPLMSIKSSVLDVDVSGSHTFTNQIDYRFAFRFRDLKEANQVSEFGEEIDDGTGVMVFMRMYGDLDDPTIVWDKEAKKDVAKQNREEAKQDAKSILKSEFGFFKNDSTVKIYQEKKQDKETLKMQFGPEETENPALIEKPKKDSKLKNKLKEMQEEADKNKKEKVEWEVD